MNISLVIPAYNERANLPRLLEMCAAALDAAGGENEVVLVDDGSSDGSDEYLAAAVERDARLRVISHAPGCNIGCHPSELEALGLVRGRVTLFLPADLQIRPDVLPLFVARHALGADIVVGWRRRRADGLVRRLVSTANNLVERLVLGVRVHDAHSAMSFSRRTLAEVVPLVASTSALIPAEILVRAQARNLRIDEIEIPHFPRDAGRQTGAKLFEIVRVQVDLLRLRQRLRREARSGPAPGTPDAPADGVHEARSHH